MRIWTIHPKYLDVMGLLALWRETLLAQNVLLNKTKGYKNHPQLIRFKSQENPIQSIANYLHIICNEAEVRNYNFNRKKIVNPLDISICEKIPVTLGQIKYEWQHFLTKIEKRDNKRFEELKNIETPIQHSIFTIVEGDIENWEKVYTSSTPAA